MRMKASLRAMATVLVALLSLLAASQSMAQEKISGKVAKPMKAAQELIQKKQWDQALEKIAEADAAAGKTPFDQFQINEFKAYVLLQQRKYPEVAKLYEESLASGKLPADQVSDRLKTLVQLNTASKNYPKVMEFGDRWIKAGGQDLDTRVLVGQAHYLQKDYKNAISIMQDVIKSAEQAGKPVDENWLQLVRSAQTNIGDADGATRTVEKLVQLYPKPEYWNFLLSSRMRQKSSDRVMLNTYRLAQQVGTLDSADDYLEMAEMLLEAGLPGEAKSVLEAGLAAKGVVDPADKARSDRYKRRLDDAKAAAAKDLQSLPQIEKDAQKSTTGQGDVALGMAYSSFGQYDKAVAALSRGIDKGGVRDPDQAQIMLGIADLKLGKKADAVKAFGQVKSDPQMADLGRLWVIVAKSGG
jgi:tetratricopeptide (TPR) repeat protein